MLSLVRQRIHALRQSTELFGGSPYSAPCLVQQRIQVHALDYGWFCWLCALLPSCQAHDAPHHGRYGSRVQLCRCCLVGNWRFRSCSSSQVVDCSFVLQRQLSMVPHCRKTIEISQLLYTVIDVPVVQSSRIFPRRGAVAVSWSRLFVGPFSSTVAVHDGRCPCCAGRAVFLVSSLRRLSRSHSSSKVQEIPCLEKLWLWVEQGEVVRPVRDVVAVVVIVSVSFQLEGAPATTSKRHWTKRPLSSVVVISVLTTSH